jgi:hypothetical protein
LPELKTVIAKKTLNAVTTNIGERYAIADETIIVGLNGKQVSIREMLVPCEVEITYKTKKGVRTAERITMTSVGKDARWQWDADYPE